MAAPRSTNLFHFTKSADVLFSILANGFYPRYVLEDAAWLGVDEPKFHSFPAVCFCDIPISRIGDHIGFYGRYGLGLSKAWALKNGLNPVFYISSAAPLAKSLLEAMYVAIRADEGSKSGEVMPAAKHLLYIFSHSKPISGTMVIQGKPVAKEFYLENEWRYVPKREIPSDEMPMALTHEAYNDEKFRAGLNDKLAKEACLKFVPSDVRYIFVPIDADIPPLVDFINSHLGQYSHTDIKILTSRITSLEHIQGDL